jgi:hypothetical protein
MSHARIEAQISLSPLPPAYPAFRRIACACGCGRWWYWRPAKHRPPSYATPDCFWRARNKRRRKAWAALSSGEDK